MAFTYELRTLLAFFYCVHAGREWVGLLFGLLFCATAVAVVMVVVVVVLVV